MRYKKFDQYFLSHTRLRQYYSCEEGFGNMYLGIKDFRPALAHFNLALKRSS